jgi:hypothetical protein
MDVERLVACAIAAGTATRQLISNITIRPIMSFLTPVYVQVHLAQSVVQSPNMAAVSPSVAITKVKFPVLSDITML